MDLSIVSPVYMSASTVLPLVQELTTVLGEQGLGCYEIILVDDGSSDQSWQQMVIASERYPHVLAIRLSRNFGQHNAIAAGLDRSTGDVVVVMDCDLQDRPAEVPHLVAKLRAEPHAECVLAVRANRQDFFLKRISSTVFYLLLRLLTGVHLDSRIANFGAYSAKMVKVINSLREPDRSFPFFVHWVGFEKAYLEVQHAPRHSGRSSYSFYALMKLAVNVGMGVSDRPMRLVMGVGAILCTTAFFFGVGLLFRYAAGQVSEPGYASIILSLWFFSGIIVLLLGFVGLYVGKIYLATKQRPIYVVNERLKDDL